jgi:hypothetical protein
VYFAPAHRSVINVLQEKQEAQERDMAIMKDDIARLRRELAAERELVKALKGQAADSTWAIADVKRGQDQVMTARSLVTSRIQRGRSNLVQRVAIYVPRIIYTR